MPCLVIKRLENTNESARVVRMLRAVTQARGVPSLFLYLVSMCRWTFASEGWEVVPDEGSVFVLFYGRVTAEVYVAG
jgi:hypothetical protein